MVCDRSGFTVWRSDCVKQWDGLLVHKRFAEARHPQDFLRAKRESLVVPDARPERAIADETFVGPLVTETTAADSIVVYLSNGDLHRNTISSVDTSTTLTLSSALPGAVDSGAKVIDYSATAS